MKWIELWAMMQVFGGIIGGLIAVTVIGWLLWRTWQEVK